MNCLPDYLFQKFQEFVLCQNGDSQLPGLALLGASILANYDEAGFL